MPGIHLFFLLLLTTTLNRPSVASLIDKQTYYVEYNSDINTAYHKLINLEFEKARTILDSITTHEPANLATVHMLNYADCIELFINENKERYQILKKNKNKRIKYIRSRLPYENPFRAYLIGELNLQWSFVKPKFDDKLLAAKELWSSYQILEELENSAPEFIYHKKPLSILHSIIETLQLPAIVKKVFNINASVYQAKDQLNHVLKLTAGSDYIFFNECEAIYLYLLYFQLDQKEEATEFYQTTKLREWNSALSTFLNAHFLAHNGQNQKAIDQIDGYLQKKPNASFDYLHFMQGLYKLRKLDPSSKQDFLRFAQDFKGEHHIKECYQKLAWCALVFENDTSSYYSYMKDAGDKGMKVLDGDLRAYKDFKNNYIPNIKMLQAGLFFDGANYNKALDKLYNHVITDEKEKDFYEYRIARCLQELKRNEEAIKLYKNLLENQNRQKNYFYCNASLQLARIYEKGNQLSEAEKYYKLCLQLEPDSYKRSLHQKARSGIERLKKW
jgi:hypothetical protein